MFTVVVHTKTGTEEHSYASRKIAEKQFEQSKLRPDIWFITIVHTVRRDDTVILFWERPNPLSNEHDASPDKLRINDLPTRGQ